MAQEPNNNVVSLIEPKNDITDDTGIFTGARNRLTDILTHYALFDSYRKITASGAAYPFIARDRVLPNLDARHYERAMQNTAFVILIDDRLPQGLAKHFRLRSSNRVTWRNLSHFMPELDIDDFKAAHCQVKNPEFPTLLRRLLPADYALLQEAPSDARSAGLSHMHIKVERLTDIALRELGLQLGYVEKKLFERGEDFVDALEGKFFEYFGFAANASGRKSAAAIAAQLLQRAGGLFTVFVAGQSDARLTLLCQNEVIEQRFLIQLSEPDDLQQAKDAAKRMGLPDLADYQLPEDTQRPSYAYCYRVRFHHTDAAKASEHRRPTDDIQRPWLCIGQESLLPWRGQGPALDFHWAQE